jgi:hypothetical protein
VIQVLEAAALAEKPLLTANGVTAVHLGLKTLRFHYYSLVILLTVSSKQLRAQCIHLSQEMLALLPSLDDPALGVKNSYTGLLWQRLHCPLTAFGSLWGEIVVRPKTQPEQNKQYLEAIEHVPIFLSKSSSQNPLAAKLQNITEKFVQHARMELSFTSKLRPYIPDCYGT